MWKILVVLLYFVTIFKKNWWCLNIFNTAGPQAEAPQLHSDQLKFRKRSGCRSWILCWFHVQLQPCFWLRRINQFRVNLLHDPFQTEHFDLYPLVLLNLANKIKQNKTKTKKNKKKQHLFLHKQRQTNSCHHFVVELAGLLIDLMCLPLRLNFQRL